MILFKFFTAFFVLYLAIGRLITNKELIRQKRAFDLFAFKHLRRFAYSSNKDLFKVYHRTTIKLLRVFFITFIIYSLLGGTAIYSAYLFTGSILLLISFTSPEQYKIDLRKGFSFWSQNFLLAGLGLLVLWLIDRFEGTNQLQIILAMFIEPIIQTQQSTGLPPIVFWGLVAFTLLLVLFFNFFSWMILRSCMWCLILVLYLHQKVLA